MTDYLCAPPRSVAFTGNDKLMSLTQADLDNLKSKYTRKTWHILQQNLVDVALYQYVDIYQAILEGKFTMPHGTTLIAFPNYTALRDNEYTLETMIAFANSVANTWRTVMDEILPSMPDWLKDDSFEDFLSDKKNEFDQALTYDVEAPIQLDYEVTHVA